MVKEALALVRQGRVLSLGLELNPKTPGCPPRTFEHHSIQNIGTNNSNNDDFVTASVNTGAQIDGLAHFDRYWREEPGPGIEAAGYLCEAGVVALGADTSRHDADPHERPGLFYPVHQICLAKHGVYVLENVDTKVLVDAGVTEFCLTLAPTRITGASQTWVNPVAML